MNPARLKRLGGYSLMVVAGSLATLAAVRARAAGIPDAAALTYTGYLENPDGTPVTGTKGIGISVYSAEKGGKEVCGLKPEDVEPVSGRFQLTLPDECTDAVKANPDLWVEVQVEGSLLGRTKLGAVPYALEAAHATTSDEAAHATASDNAPIVTDWEVYPGTVTASDVPIPNAKVNSTYRRVGDSAEVRIEVNFVAATATGEWRFGLPAGLQIDFTKHVQGRDLVGIARTNHGGTDQFASIKTQPATPSSVNVTPPGAGTLSGSPVTEYVTISFVVPIVGWTSLK